MEGGKGEERADIERQRRGSAVIGLREGGAIAGQGRVPHIASCSVQSFSLFCGALSQMFMISTLTYIHSSVLWVYLRRYKSSSYGC